MSFCLDPFAFCTEAKMSSAVERTDDLVKEYLIYRGFTSTLKYFDSEIKTDREKGFRVGIILNGIHTYRYIST